VCPESMSIINVTLDSTGRRADRMSYNLSGILF
jgi:hypothetical protein